MTLIPAPFFLERPDVLFFVVMAIEEPAFVQIANLPPVLSLECALQLMAQPLRHEQFPPCDTRPR